MNAMNRIAPMLRPIASIPAALASLALLALSAVPVWAQEAALPSDVYDFAPATWGDIDPALVDPGIRWSAAKAHVVLRRRGSGTEAPE